MLWHAVVGTEAFRWSGCESHASFQTCQRCWTFVLWVAFGYPCSQWIVCFRRQKQTFHRAAADRSFETVWSVSTECFVCCQNHKRVQTRIRQAVWYSTTFCFIVLSFTFETSHWRNSKASQTVGQIQDVLVWQMDLCSHQTIVKMLHAFWTFYSFSEHFSAHYLCASCTSVHRTFHTEKMDPWQLSRHVSLNTAIDHGVPVAVRIWQGVLSFINSGPLRKEH